MITALLGVLGLFTVGFSIIFIKDLMANKGNFEEGTNSIVSGLIGFGVNFFDVLGIGSFAPATALLRTFKQVDDRVIPGTLNVSCCLPVIAEAFLFISAVEVDPMTLILLLASATVGAYLGAGFMSKIERKKVQLIMGIAMIAAAAFMIMGQLELMPVGGDAIKLSGAKLIIGVVINFFLGAGMSAGVGLYAPCMAMVALLGMNITTAFPIMMGSCAFLMPAASVKFVQEGAYNKKASLVITICGVVGVFVAYKFVTGIPINILKWIVDVVVIYTAITLLIASSKDSKED